MFRFFTRLFIFFTLIVVCDRLIGFGSDFLLKNVKGGDNGMNNYIVDNLQDSILIIGSSRGMRHYDPLIIQDSLGLSCYNCSRDGNGIIMHYPFFQLYTSRFSPKLILFDVTQNFDLLQGDNVKYLSWVRPYYNRNVKADSVFYAVNCSEKIKMLSRSYQYNSKYLQLVGDCIKPMQENIKGYKPVDKTMSYDVNTLANSGPEVYKYDNLKIHYIERLVKECKTKGIKIVFFTSPSYKAYSSLVFKPIRDLSNKYSIPFFEHYTDSNFVDNKDYFYDSVHMNRTGASLYTKSIISELRSVLY